MSLAQVDTEHPIIIPGPAVQLEGLLHIPPEVKGLVLFAHGSGSSRFSTRNQFVARSLHEAKLATLLFDLLTPEEDELDAKTLELRFDIELLASRLLQATDWALQHPLTEKLPLAYFGASTGAAAALVAAAERPERIKALVSRGGRPDLAEGALSRVKAPTLLIVGGNDATVIEFNKKAATQLKAPHQLELVPYATHLFEEPGALAKVAQLAQKWFLKYFV